MILFVCVMQKWELGTPNWHARVFGGMIRSACSINNTAAAFFFETKCCSASTTPFLYKTVHRHFESLFS